jgi:hypothetical protein
MRYIFSTLNTTTSPRKPLMDSLFFTLHGVAQFCRRQPPDDSGPVPEPGPPLFDRNGGTKPNKAKWVNLLAFKEMRQKFIKRSQTIYPLVFKRLTAKKGAIFAKNECEQRECDVLLPGNLKTKPNEAKQVNHRAFSEMHEKFIKRSQTTYLLFHQQVATKKPAIFGKNKCGQPESDVLPGNLKTKPNEAKWVNPRSFSEMHEKFIKRSQTAYPLFIECITTKNQPIFAKNECAQYESGKSRTGIDCPAFDLVPQMLAHAPYPLPETRHPAPNSWHLTPGTSHWHVEPAPRRSPEITLAT